MEEENEQVHVILSVVLDLVKQVDLGVEPEPEEGIEQSDNVIGTASKSAICLFVVQRKLGTIFIRAFKGLIDETIDKFKNMTDEEIEKRMKDRENGLEAGEQTEAQRSFHEGYHPQLIALGNAVADLFKQAVIYDAVDRDLSDKEITLRKGWIAVWYEPVKEEEEQPEA